MQLQGNHLNLTRSDWLRIGRQTGWLRKASAWERTATIAVFRNSKDKGIEVLLGKRKKNPMAGSIALPGGHIKPNETELAGGIRELREETGIKVEFLIPVGKEFGAPDRSKVNYIFTTVIDPSTEAKGGSDLEDVIWVPVGKVPPLVFGDDVFKSLTRAFDSNILLKKVAGYIQH